MYMADRLLWKKKNTVVFHNAVSLFLFVLCCARRKDEQHCEM